VSERPTSDAGPPEEGTPPAGQGTEEPGDAEPRPGLPRARRTARPRARAAAAAGEGQAASVVATPAPVDEEALALARRVVDLAADKKAADIVLLDVHALTAVTDYFVICSGASDRQLGAIVDGILEGLKADGVVPIGREGGPVAHWLLVDIGSVIVHVMSPPEREYYALEKLWSEAPLLLRVL
jgi:ribosome-associated protein